MKTPRTRARRDTRKSDVSPIRLTARDLDILEAVYHYRVLTTNQLQMLFFPSLHRAYARLAELYTHGLLERRFLGIYADKMNTPILYVLDKGGAEALRAHRGLEVVWSRSVRDITIQFLEHTLAINTVRVAVSKACRLAGFTLVKWLGENELKADYDYVSIRVGERLQSVSVIPDSYFVLETPMGLTHVCLELDRGKMTVERFKKKILAYQVYYASGDYSRRYGTKSLRVLTVTLSPKRLENLRKTSEAAGAKQRFWFSTLDLITPEAVLTSSIWQVATNSELQPLIDLKRVEML